MHQLLLNFNRVDLFLHCPNLLSYGRHPLVHFTKELVELFVLLLHQVIEQLLAFLIHRVLVVEPLLLHDAIKYFLFVVFDRLNELLLPLLIV